MFKSANVQKCKCSKVQMYQYANVQICLLCTFDGFAPWATWRETPVHYCIIAQSACSCNPSLIVCRIDLTIYLHICNLYSCHFLNILSIGQILLRLGTNLNWGQTETFEKKWGLGRFLGLLWDDDETMMIIMINPKQSRQICVEWVCILGAIFRSDNDKYGTPLWFHNVE